jgi:outer membrane receptor protein involved in Fe transport
MTRRVAGLLLIAAFGLANLLESVPGDAQDTNAPPASQGPPPSETPVPPTGEAVPSTGNPPPSETPVPPTGEAAPSTGNTTVTTTPAGPATLPPVVITTPSTKAKPKAAPHKAVAAKPSPAQAKSTEAQPKSTKAAQPAAGAAPASAEAGALAVKEGTFNQARGNLLTTVGTSSYDFSQQAIETLPQGTETPVDKVLLQAPGVAQDSAASGLLHVRNEHANVQYRINGIILPDGVVGFGQVLETNFVRGLSLVTGALPAEYGYRTSGLVDIQTKSGAENAGGNISMYGGSQSTLTPSIEYGGYSGNTDYFFTGRYFTSDEGIENPTSSLIPIHDDTEQGRAFGYVSTLLSPNTRLSFISGTSVQNFQIPNRPGQPPMFPAFGVTTFNSALLNENQLEQNYYDVVALQRKEGDVDWQLAYFARYSDLHFTPDEVGDIIFNGVASNVDRSSVLNGIQGDGSYKVNSANTVRSGFYVSAEQTAADNTSTVLPLDSAGNPVDAPFNVTDNVSKLGWLLGVYLQDEWKLTDRLTLNAGIRFDQMFQFVDANQFSPRINLVYKPLAGTTFHIGYARYFTPPPQVAAGPVDLAAFQNTTQQPAINQASLPLPERAHYFDVGVTQKILPGLEVGVDGYYKRARDLLDDGQFGAALVLDAFNYATGINEGIEVKATYEHDGFKAYGNIAFANQQATQVASGQFRFDPVTFAYIADHFIYTDHNQTMTASAGMSYLWNGNLFTADMIYGSGLRSGFANTDHVPAYTQVNLGVSHDFTFTNAKPLTLRFDVVNVFDTIYEIRSGSGIGVFAPQFGPRRGFFVRLSRKF